MIVNPFSLEGSKICRMGKGYNLGLCTSRSRFNSFPKDKILNFSKMKAFADNKLDVAQKVISVFDKAEKNIVGKENAVISIFSFFHTVLPRIR